jgi:hypothetical protein
MPLDSPYPSSASLAVVGLAGIAYHPAVQTSVSHVRHLGRSVGAKEGLKPLAPWDPMQNMQ